MLLSHLFAHPSRIAGHPIYRDACAIWDFSRESGNQVFDRSIVDRPYHGTFGGIGGTGIQRIVSPYGPAIKNDNAGTDRRVNLGSITSADMLSGVPTGELTLIAHVQNINSYDNGYPRLIDKSNSGSGAGGYSWTLRNGVFWLYVDGTNLTPSGPAIGNDGYYFYGLQIKSSLIKVYQQGIQLGSTDTSSLTFPSTTTSMALTNWNHSTDRNFQHPVIMMAAWPRILTAQEHKQIATEALYGQYKVMTPIRFPIQGGAPPVGWSGVMNRISGGSVNRIANANIQSVNKI